MWTSNDRETRGQIEMRAKAVLDMVFENDKEHCKDQFFLFRVNEGTDEICPVISITSHSSFIDAFLRVAGHRPWALSTGGTQSYTLIVFFC